MDPERLRARTEGSGPTPPRDCGRLLRSERGADRQQGDGAQDQDRPAWHARGSGRFAILQLIYQQKAYEGHAKDYEFSATSMREHWSSGYEDTRRTLSRREWIQIPPDGGGIVVHDVHRQQEDG